MILPRRGELGAALQFDHISNQLHDKSLLVGICIFVQAGWMNYKLRAISLYLASGILFAAAFGTTGCTSVTTPDVTVTPHSLTIHPGDQNVPVTVNIGKGGFIGSVAITVLGLPSGITASSLTLNPGQSGTLQFSASLSADQEAFPAADATDANTDVRSVIVSAAAGPNIASSTMSLTVSLTNPTYTPDTSKINLPIVKIDSSGTPIVDKTTEVPGTITITSADGQTSYLPNGSDSDNTATFHLHGQSTAAMPKKPYHVKLNTSLESGSTPWG